MLTSFAAAPRSTNRAASTTPPGGPGKLLHITIRSLTAIARVLVITGVSLSAVAAVTQAVNPQREDFAQVLAAQKSGRHDQASRLAAGLEDYPLYPYYLYNDLKRRLHHLPVEAVAEFLNTHDGSYLAARLREEWLAQLAYAKRWATFLEFYRSSDDLVLRCRELTARIHLGRDDGVIEATRAIWLDGESLPDACDPPFERLYASPVMDDDLVWQRIVLARAAGNNSLADYLGRRLRGSDYRARHALWQQALAQPGATLGRRDLTDDAATQMILAQALARLARIRLESAETAWRSVRERYAFSAADGAQVARDLAVAAAASDHERRLALLDRVPTEQVDPLVERYRIREGIAAAAWPELVRWTAQPPRGDVYPLRWRYWRARALQATGQTEAAHAIWAELANERDYYGFLAADALERDYDFNHRPVAAGTAETAVLAARPGLVRAHELYRLDRRYQAYREWRFELDRMDRREREVAASIATEWGWLNQTIATLGRAESYDDLELRFPVRHADLAAEYAAKRGLAAARILAIIRSESAFVHDARSAAGALGLMQLMPATARETARRIGLRLDHLSRLYQPRENIALGSAYLQQMIARFGGNFVMAAAAYNAGPHRVRQWQGDTCAAADIWIDTIPFTETRRYARRALFYTAVYEWRLGHEITRLSSVMPPIPAKRSTGDMDCEA
ncbi:MAG: transglycosylase SLT domain-containing protein [Gammaproteobacteria bacterium]